MIAAIVANTKLSPVSGHRKLISLFDIRKMSEKKKSASNSKPSPIWGLVAAALAIRNPSLKV